MTSLDLNTCQVEAFVAEVTAQPGSLTEAASTQEIFTQQVEGYLNRLVAALCADLQLLEATDIDTFIGLQDTPAAYVADAAVRVNAGGTALEFTTFIDTFLELLDTPGAYVADSPVRVNAAGTALEFGQSPSLDHGALLGLADNDHPQYVLDAGDTMTGALRFNDNVAIELGTAGDSTLLYNGTNALWDLAAVGSGVLAFTSGDVRLLDNVELQLGTGGATDSRLWWNGSNMVWDIDPTAALIFQADVRFQDNWELHFGTGADARFWYDGTNMHIDPDAVGTGFLQVGGGLRSTANIRANGVFNHNGTAGISASASWEDAATGDAISLTASGGIVTVLTVTPP